MQFAATHLSPWLTVTLAAILFAGMAWYWPRLASPDIPGPRRRVRRASLVCGLIGLVAVTLGFGIVDPDATPLRYFVAWAVAAIALLGVVVLAMMDAFISMRLHQRAFDAMRRESAQALGKAIADAALSENKKRKLKDPA